MKELKLFQTVEFKLVDSFGSMADVYKGTDGYTNDDNRMLGIADERAEFPAQEQTVIINTVTQTPQPTVPTEVTELYIEGYASVFISKTGEQLVDRDNESVNIAFLDIESYRDNPVLNFNHHFDEVIGKTVAIQKDAKGLYIRAVVHKLTGREHIFEAVQKGLIKAFSIGFVPKLKTLLDEDVIEISMATLVEISIVGTQANQESLFGVIGQKGATVSKKALAKQNQMSCSELDGSCAFKEQLNQKGVNMENSEVVQVKDEVKPTEVVQVKAEVAEVVQVKEEVKPKVFDEAAMVAAITDAQVKAEEIKIARALEADNQAKAKLEAEKAAELAKIAAAHKYIKDQTDLFINTPSDDIDTETIEAFYELISSSVEAIDAKIVSAIKGAVEV